jgi:hypothetical protein
MYHNVMWTRSNATDDSGTCTKRREWSRNVVRKKRRHSKSPNETAKTQRGRLFWSITPENLNQTFNQNDYREKSYCLSSKKSQMKRNRLGLCWHFQSGTCLRATDGQIASNWQPLKFTYIRENFPYKTKKNANTNETKLQTSKSYSIINSQNTDFC